jgi:hypothetical protein
MVSGLGPNSQSKSGRSGEFKPHFRGKRKKAAASAEPPSPDQASEDAAIPGGPYRAALRRRWSELIRRVYEVDPLISLAAEARCA